MFGITKRNRNVVSIDVSALVKQLVESMIGSLCEKFVTRADVDSIVLETVERVLAAKSAVSAVSDNPVSEEPVQEIVENPAPVKKPTPAIIGNPRKTHVD